MVRRTALITIAAFSAVIAGIEGWWNALWDRDFPPPPVWLQHFSSWFFAHMLEPVYWTLATVSFTTWFVLDRQKRRGEKSPARWLRRVSFAKGMLWTGLAFGRVFSDWRQSVYVMMTIYVLVASLCFMIAILYAYVWKPLRGHPRPPGGLEGEVLPTESYGGPNRRSRRPGRRTTDFA